MGALPLWGNALLFAVAAAAIWAAGTRLERAASALAQRTRLGLAFSGMLLLAIATSLPEVATTVTAIALLDNPTLAVHNLIGGVAMQTAIIAFADVAKRKRGALTFFTPRFVLLVEGVGLVVLLSIAMAALTARGVPVIAGLSVWLVVLGGAYIGVMYLVYRHRDRPRWIPVGEERPAADEAEPRSMWDDLSTTKLWLVFAAASLVVLLGGWLATQTAERLAEETGLGDAFLGATLLALATSLPELSATTAASRKGRYSVAMSNVFGSNAFDVVLLLLADLLYRGGTVLADASRTVIFVAAIAALMTCIYLWGLLERENRTVWRMGWDSASVLVVYLAAMTVLYFIQ